MAATNRSRSHRTAALLARWCTAMAVLLACVPPSRRSMAEARTLERDVFALIAFYQEVKDRDLEWRGAMAKWPVHTCNVEGVCAVDPCGDGEWAGDDKEPWHGVTCRYQWNWDKSIPRVVTNIHLPKRGLTGPLPRSLVLFANITEIDMDSNRLTGTLPPEWGCLRNLIEIDLSKNLLVGTIPQEYGLLSGLVEFELDGNRGVSGCVPDGCPPFNRFCSRFFGNPCPSFTTDRLIGTDNTNTGIRGRCAPVPGGKAALAAGLRCPVAADFATSIDEFFGAKGGAAMNAPARVAAPRVTAADDKPAAEADEEADEEDEGDEDDSNK